jgi:glycosyltransferase involved in cell wall biosynthesis
MSFAGQTANSRQGISIVIPTKNRRELLVQTLKSVLTQSLGEWEALVVDDGSSDGTAEYVQKLNEHDKRIRFIVREGEAPGANICRNQGARLATYDYLMFLDSDDLLKPDCLRARFEWISRNPNLDFAVFHAEAFVETTGDLSRPACYHSLTGDLDRFLYFDLPWLITGPIWRKAAFEKLGGFDETIPSWQDIELHIRAILSGCRYLNLPITDYDVRWQNDPAKTSLQQRRSEHHILAGERIVENFSKLLHESGNANWSRLRGIASLKFLLAEFWSRQRRYRDAHRVWNSLRCSAANSTALFWGGHACLIVRHLGLIEMWPFSKLFNHWKGSVRLRDQPRLLFKPIPAKINLG